MRAETNDEILRPDLRARLRVQLAEPDSRLTELGMCRSTFRTRKSSDKRLSREQIHRSC